MYVNTFLIYSSYKPVELIFAIRPVKDEFETLFPMSMDAQKNSKFLQHISVSNIISSKFYSIKSCNSKCDSIWSFVKCSTGKKYYIYLSFAYFFFKYFSRYPVNVLKRQSCNECIKFINFNWPFSVNIWLQELLRYQPLIDGKKYSGPTPSYKCWKWYTKNKFWKDTFMVLRM